MHDLNGRKFAKSFNELCQLLNIGIIKNAKLITDNGRKILAYNISWIHIPYILYRFGIVILSLTMILGLYRQRARNICTEHFFAKQKLVRKFSGEFSKYVLQSGELSMYVLRRSELSECVFFFGASIHRSAVLTKEDEQLHTCSVTRISGGFLVWSGVTFTSHSSNPSPISVCIFWGPNS